jgi:hypothetical protein
MSLGMAWCVDNEEAPVFKDIDCVWEIRNWLPL